MLADSLQVPVGLILNAVGGSPTEAWIDRKTLEFEFPDILQDWTKNDFIQDWVRERAALNIKQASNPLQRHPYEPCYLFEAGIQPLHRYPIKGIIWYQGESNAHNMKVHERLFPLLVNSWRQNWNAALPFYYVQLSSIDRPSWTWFRDSQRRLAQTVSNTGMAVSSDRGDSLNVHPTRKKEIGERLAHWALNKTYGHNVIPSALCSAAQRLPITPPISLSITQRLDNFRWGPHPYIRDRRAGRTLLSGASRGRERESKGVERSSDSPEAGTLRLATFTRANLINEAGMPASTFRAIKE